MYVRHLVGYMYMLFKVSRQSVYLVDDTNQDVFPCDNGAFLIADLTYAGHYEVKGTSTSAATATTISSQASASPINVSSQAAIASMAAFSFPQSSQASSHGFAFRGNCAKPQTYQRLD